MRLPAPAPAEFGLGALVAQAIGWDDRIGSLKVGFGADITVLELEDRDLDLEDGQGQLRQIKQVLKPVACWRDGHAMTLTEPRIFPDPVSTAVYGGDVAGCNPSPPSRTPSPTPPLTHTHSLLLLERRAALALGPRATGKCAAAARAYRACIFS